MVRLSTRCTRAVSKQTPGPLGVLWAVISTGTHIRHDAKPRVELSHSGFRARRVQRGRPRSARTVAYKRRDGHPDKLFGSTADTISVKDSLSGLDTRH